MARMTREWPFKSLRCTGWVFSSFPAENPCREERIPEPAPVRVPEDPLGVAAFYTCDLAFVNGKRHT